MKKIPTIFKRNPEKMSEVVDEPNESCLWVFDGEGIATRKYDGTCVLIKDGAMFKRREVNPGKQIPEGFVQADFDEITGKTVGWMPVDFEAKSDKWHAAAFTGGLKDGTHELVGEKVQGNPEGVIGLFLQKHSDAEQYSSAPRTFDGLREFMAGLDIEGLVFHHPDGRMAKIKKRDYGMKR